MNALRQPPSTIPGSARADPDDALPRSLIGTVPMLMVEQDATWGPPSESAAIGRRVLATALRRHARADSTGSAGAPG